ncbi:Woronin body major [Hyphodiscus hymeniophilus]|uniref:Woronin body major n=1 Tax=Hyphodiscus hymeniophilus TaxID=353542 RepID=A0A9P6VMR2_9HELO|nr:Woronin body major [Hyphodiscus hymeniophilus]
MNPAAHLSSHPSNQKALTLFPITFAHLPQYTLQHNLNRKTIVNLDFDARVPIPFSIFPSSYKNDAGTTAETTTETQHFEGEINLPAGVGREDKYSSYAANLPPRDERFRQEEVRITREEDRHRPNERRREEIYVREERRPDHHKHAEAHLEINTPHHRREYGVDVKLPHLHRPHLPHFHHNKTEVDIEVDRPYHRRSEIDITESQYRSKFQPSYREEIRVNESSEHHQSKFQPSYREDIHINASTVDAPRSYLPTYKEEVHLTETVEPSSFKQNKMGYYDEDGHYHSLRHGLHRAAEKIVGGGHRHHHHDREEIDIEIGSAPRKSSSEGTSPHTVTIPCHHIRLGDLLMLQGRPCQVIKISTSNSTGQHRYLGVDLFTKELHEESAFISNPSPSVVVQTMLGPVFKQYRVLDLQDRSVVAMTETGDVKQGLPVIDQSKLWSRLSEAFESGRGSVRVLVISDHGRELVVDMKILHGSRL